jgi:4-hydroxy-tetrahydrodipicolinate synthase
LFELDSYHGIFPPSITPLNADESVDAASTRSLTEYLIDSGVHGIWAMGTTGEFPALDPYQREVAISATMEAVRGRVPVIVNISDGGTGRAIEHARIAQRLGADAIAATPTYYFNHSQDEMLSHYRAIRNAVDLPLFIYNFPQMVKLKLDVATVATLAGDGTVVGIKDSQNDLQWFRALMTATKERGVNFRGFLGTRTLIDAGLIVGAHGAVPSVSNIAPRLVVDMYDAAKSGDFGRAGRLQDLIIRYDNLSASIAGGSANSQLIGMLKAVLEARGVIAGATVAQPLRPLTSEDLGRIRERLAGLPSAEPVAA